MSNVFEKIEEMKFDESAIATLSYKQGTDVFVYNETEVETALYDTDVVQTFADLITTPNLDAQTVYGDNILEALRDIDLLEDYQRDGTFSSYVANMLDENFYDAELIEYTIEKYDYKRGFCTLSAEVQVPLQNLLTVKPDLTGWSVAVKGANGATVTFEN